MARKAINIYQFSAIYAEIYNRLYNSSSESDARLEAAAAEVFDNSLEKNEAFRDFVREYVEFRGDPITSDREAASFILALDELANGKEEARTW